MSGPVQPQQMTLEPNSGSQDVACWAATAQAGHFDELRGGVLPHHLPKALGDEAPDFLAQPDQLAPGWHDFFTNAGINDWSELNLRTDQLARQIRDNGTTYNVYADSQDLQRPWALDLFPLVISPASWKQIENGVLQRVQLLNAIMTDVYGPQELLHKGLLPAALVHGHPGYIRALHGVNPVGGNHLNIAAFDLARGPDGMWWVMAQRTQAPSGLGYLMENRLSISRQFPQAFETMQVQHLASTYRALIEGIRQMSPAGTDAHIALLTPGPYNETYFEHAYLARYLGLTLVQGNDLVVRNCRLYLRTLEKLEPIDSLIKRVDDVWLDPLELRPDSSLGVPGLLQAIRAGNVLVVNAPGSGFLESNALLGFLPALSQHLLDQELQLPAAPTWWCGEQAAVAQILPRLTECVIHPTYPKSPNLPTFDPVRGSELSRSAQDEWAGKIMREGDLYTLQANKRLSQMPIWNSDPQRPRMELRSVMLRVFAMADGRNSWRVLPGGLARLVSADDGMATMQRGGSSADVWVRTEGEVDRTSLLQPQLTPAMVMERRRLVTSRAAENLYWLGRYTERSENTLRLVRLTLEALNGEHQGSVSLMKALQLMTEHNHLIPTGTPSPLQSRRVFERALIASLNDHHHSYSLGFDLQAVKTNASAVRDRLSLEQWRLTVRAEQEFRESCASLQSQGDFSFVQVLRTLDTTSATLAAMTGAQIDRMTRDEGWRLMTIGRFVERLDFLSSATKIMEQSDGLHEAGGFAAILSLFDSTITFHANYQQSRSVCALLELLVMSDDNPRSLAWVTRALRKSLSKLPKANSKQMKKMLALLPDPKHWELDVLCNELNTLATFGRLLDELTQASWTVSDEISLRFFTHTQDVGKSLST